jgi:hydrogenase small subunit
MQIHRRQFLKYCIGSAAALGLPLTVVGKLENALADEGVQLPKVIWLNGANCTGCTVSLANRFSDQGPTDVADLLTGYIDLAFHPNLMAAAGDLALQCLKDAADGGYILAVDGGIPTAFNGHTCTLWTDDGKDITAKEAVQLLAPNAAAILSIGTCASFGGIPAANPNPTGIAGVSEIAGKTTINIPGCPTHPDWIVWTVASLLAGEIPQLDDHGRPRLLFREEIHKKCPRKEGGEAKIFGEEKCLKELGCKGEKTKADCHIRQWNDGTNWCIGANAICLGCTEDGFPDRFSPFYKIEYKYQTYEKPVDQPVNQPPNNPSDDETPTPEPTTLRITRAEWRTDYSVLRVNGEGNVGAIVKVSDADSGAVLGAVSVGSEGRWRFRQRNPISVPRRIRAESSGIWQERDVRNAPQSTRSLNHLFEKLVSAA